jgi:hypothetical protein
MMWVRAAYDRFAISQPVCRRHARRCELDLEPVALQDHHHSVDVLHLNSPAL